MAQVPTAETNDSSPTDAVEAQRLLEAEEGLLRRPRDWSRWVVPVLAVAWSLMQILVATEWEMDSMKLRALHLGFALAITYFSFPSGKGAGRGRLGRLRRRIARGGLRLLHRTHLTVAWRWLRRVVVLGAGLWLTWALFLGDMLRSLIEQRALILPQLANMAASSWADLTRGDRVQPLAEPFAWQFSEQVTALPAVIAVGALLLLASWLRPRKNAIPASDWMLGLIGCLSAAYLVLDYEGYISRQGDYTQRDVVVAISLIVVLLEAARRTIGPALCIVALAFTGYCIPRFAQGLADTFAWGGVSLSAYVGQMARSPEGIYGTPLAVSAEVVFLFVLFGAMLERAGGGKFFIDLALSLLGGFRGGPAKAAVLGSGLTGMISGSSIANIVTTGTFTIPLMKKVGYPPEKAAAIEVAASTDGQLAPPVMGAAAFIIAEYLGMPFRTIILAAAIPALASYCALFYITHLEACKLGLKGLPKSEMPSFWRVLRGGWHFLIPLFTLLYTLLFAGRTAETAAAYAIAAMAVVMLLQYPVRAVLSGAGGIGAALWRGVKDIFAALHMGGRNMIPVAIATAAAGIVVGVVSLGPGAKIAQIVDHLSQGNVLLMLIITAIGCLIIGMGLPTTATYVVMAALLAPAIETVGASQGLVIVPLAAHLFVFYFGILADDTPPVGLAAYAAAAIAKSNPVITGLQAFMYDIRTAILPFMFIFNMDIILQATNPEGGFTTIRDPLAIGLITVCVVVGNLSFAAATQGYLLRRMGWHGLYEIPMLLAATFSLMRPDQVAAWLAIPYEQRYWTALIGIALIALTFLSQWLRNRRDPEVVDGGQGVMANG